MAQLINACINNEYDSALNWNRELSAIIDECIGTQFYIQYIFWSTFLFKQCIMNKKKMPWLTSRRIKRHMSMLTQCAKECPENYAAMVTLLSAINERKKTIDVDECERAINLAINNNQPHIEALACEQIMIRNSDAFERASQAYERWGAYNKSVQIQNIDYGFREREYVSTQILNTEHKKCTLAWRRWTLSLPRMTTCGLFPDFWRFAFRWCC